MSVGVCVFSRSDHEMNICTNGDVVQLARTLPCHGRGRGFESRRPRHNSDYGYSYAFLQTQQDTTKLTTRVESMICDFFVEKLSNACLSRPRCLHHNRVAYKGLNSAPPSSSTPTTSLSHQQFLYEPQRKQLTQLNCFVLIPLQSVVRSNAVTGRPLCCWKN